MNTRKLLVAVALVSGVFVAGLQHRPTAPDLPLVPVLQQALASYSAGNYDEAVVLAKRVLNEAPVAAWGLLGAAHCKQLDVSQAKIAYKKLLKINPDEANFVRRTCETRGVALGARQS